MATRQILHIEVGDENWNPSDADLKKVTQMFLTATLDPEGAVVATRTGVKARIIEIQDGVELQVVSAKLETPPAK